MRWSGRSSAIAAPVRMTGMRGKLNGGETGRGVWPWALAWLEEAINGLKDLCDRGWVSRG